MQRYQNGRTASFRCERCGGLIPGYSVWEKEVWEQEPAWPDDCCNCGKWEAIRNEMLAVFASSRAVALRRFRKAAARLNLPDCE